jgi:hypothetical protein
VSWIERGFQSWRDRWSGFRGKKSRVVLSIRFDVGIQIAFNPERIYKRIRLVISVILFTMVRTERKDGSSAKTEPPRKLKMC